MKKVPLEQLCVLEDGRACASCIPGKGCLSRNPNSRFFSYTCYACKKASIGVYGTEMSCTNCLLPIYMERKDSYLCCKVCGPAIRFHPICNGHPDTRRIPKDASYVCSIEHNAELQKERAERKRVSMYLESDGLRLLHTNVYSTEELPRGDLYHRLPPRIGQDYLLYDLSAPGEGALPMGISPVSYFKDPRHHNACDMLVVARKALTIQQECDAAQWLADTGHSPEMAMKVFQSRRALLGHPAVLLQAGVCPLCVIFVQLKDERPLLRGAPGLSFRGHSKLHLFAVWCTDKEEAYKVHRTMRLTESTAQLLEFITSRSCVSPTEGEEMLVQKAQAIASTASQKPDFNPLAPPMNEYSLSEKKNGPTKHKKKKKSPRGKKKRKPPSEKDALQKKQKKKLPQRKRAKKNPLLDSALMLEERLLDFKERVANAEQRLQPVNFYFFMTRIFYEKLVRVKFKDPAKKAPESLCFSETPPDEELLRLARAFYWDTFDEPLLELSISQHARDFLDTLLLYAHAMLLKELPAEHRNKPYKEICKARLFKGVLQKIIEDASVKLALFHHRANLEQELEKHADMQKRQSGKLVMGDHPTLSGPLGTTQEEKKQEEKEAVLGKDEDEDEEDTFSGDDGWSPPPDGALQEKADDAYNKEIWERVTKRSAEKLLQAQLYEAQQMARLEKARLEAEETLLKKERETRALREARQQQAEAEQKRLQEQRQAQREARRRARAQETATIEFNELQREEEECSAGEEDFGLSLDLGSLRMDQD